MEIKISSDGKNLLIVDEIKGVLLEDVSVGLEITGENYDISFIRPDGTWTQRWENQQKVFTNCSFEVIVFEEGNEVMWKVRYRNDSKNEIKGLTSLQCISARWIGIPKTAVYSNGCKWPEWYPFENHVSMSSPVETTVFLPDKLVTAENVIAIKGMNNKSISVGFVSMSKQFNKLYFSGEGVLSASCLLEYTSLEPGLEISSELLRIAFPEDPVAGLLEYGKAVRKASNVNINKEVPTGWMTWYYYLSNFTGGDVLENVQALANIKEQLPIQHIIIDLGWFKSYGDWEENGKFASSMKELADEIKKHGFIPALWLAPFCISEDSSVYRDHPEWLVKGGDGKPYRANIGDFPYGIDGTHPEVHEWFTTIFTKVTKEWGYKYLKLDFLVNGTFPGTRYKKNATAADGLREGLEVIRAAVGEDVFILGCTSPFGPAVGVVDGMRIGPDIFENWASIKVIANPILKRYFMHENYFINDPDCLIARDSKSEDEKCMRKFIRTAAEIETYFTVMAASGGVSFVSDHMGLLKDYSRAYQEKVLPPTGKAAVPIDLFESEIPGILSFGEYNGMDIFALINWGEYEKEMSLPESVLNRNVGSHLFDFWNDKYLGKISEELDNRNFIIKPHHTLVLFVTKDMGKPELIGSNLHIAGGINSSFNEESRELVVKAEKVPSFQPHIYLSAQETIKEIINGEILEWKDGIFKIKINNNTCLIKFN